MASRIEAGDQLGAVAGVLGFHTPATLFVDAIT